MPETAYSSITSPFADMSKSARPKRLKSVPLIFRSFSRELTKADKLDELDERNQLIALKSNSKTSQITQLGSGILTVAFIGMGGGSGNKDFITMGVGAAFCFTISLFAEMFTKIYYEKHN